MKKILLTISFLSLFICLALMNSCSNETETLNLDYGYEYFPLKVGSWTVYEVDSISYSQFLTGGVDTNSIQLREDIVGEFTDNEGNPAVTIERRIRSNTNAAWESITPTVWWASQTDDRAERMEGNLRFMKLSFPISESRKWAGNTYINTSDPELSIYNDWLYEYQDIGLPVKVGELGFNETVKVVQNNYDDYVQKIYSEEVYAKNVGLISKTQWILKIGSTLQIPCCKCRCECFPAPPDCACSDSQQNEELNSRPVCAQSSNSECTENDKLEQCPWPKNAETGDIVTYKIIEYSR